MKRSWVEISVLSLIIILLAGCTNVTEMQKGQCVVVETQVEGIDLSVPIPFVENVALLNLRFGFVQTKVYKGYDVPYESTSSYENISLLKGEGSISRKLIIGKVGEGNE